MSKYVNNAGKPKSKQKTKEADVEVEDMDGGEYDATLDAAKEAVAAKEADFKLREELLAKQEAEIAAKAQALAQAEADARVRLDAEVKAKLESITKQQEELVKQQEAAKQQQSVEDTRSINVKVESVRDVLLKCFVSHAKGHVDKHLANVEVLLTHPVGVGNNGDIIEEIEKELEEVAKYDDLLDMVTKYLK